MEEGEAPDQRTRRATSRPLQPDLELHGRILARIDRVEPTVRADQLAKDRDTLVRLQLAEFAGDEWMTVRERLWLYAWRTLPAKIIGGEVFRLCREVGVPAASDLQAPAGGVAQDDATDLAVDVIELALPTFKIQLTDGKWDPYREEVACLDTYWFGWCLLKFPGPWRKRARRLNRERSEAAAAVVDAGRAVVEGPEQMAVLRHDADRVLRRLPEDVQPVVALDALGYTGPEVAAHLDLTAKTVEGRLRKARLHAERWRESGPGAA